LAKAAGCGTETAKTKAQQTKGKEGREGGRMRRVKLGVLCAAWLVQAVAFAPSGMVLRCRNPSVRLLQQILDFAHSFAV
jgi:hypothetical protein